MTVRVPVQIGDDDMVTSVGALGEYVHLPGRSPEAGVQRFWIVWSPAGKTPPSRKHYTVDKAIAEAERLARENPGEEFYVLEVVDGYIAPTSVEQIKIKENVTWR